MKSILKLSLLAAVAAVVAAGSAFADDQRLEDLHARRNFEPSRSEPSRTTTVAVYTENRGLGKTVTVREDQQEPVRFELHSNGHGQVFGLYRED